MGRGTGPRALRTGSFEDVVALVQAFGELVATDEQFPDMHRPSWELVLRTPEGFLARACGIVRGSPRTRDSAAYTDLRRLAGHVPARGDALGWSFTT